MKIIIAGGRSFNNYKLLKQKCNQILRNQSIIEIVSGTARGADKLGEQYAIENNYTLSKFPAKWNEHGKSAGFIRNIEMSKYADALIAFWDNKSNGTKHMIDTATNAGLKVKVIHY